MALSQAAWNTIRIGLLADEADQARLQAVTSMAFTLGFPIGMLWGGLVIDLFGTAAPVGAAAVLGILRIPPTHQ